MDDQGGTAPERRPEVSLDFVEGQLAAAFTTALTHQDAPTRDRAEAKLSRWREVLHGIRSGILTVGSRQPVTTLPVWVTPEVIRGGFATGTAAAAGPLAADERELAQLWQVEPTREALFHYALTEPGIRYLAGLLARRTYRVELPEEAVLLTVAWLAAAGELGPAADLVQEVAPFVGQLRFLPRIRAEPLPAPDLVWRRTAAEGAAELASRRPNRNVETMREALAVWAPFGDELLSLWLETGDGGRVGRRIPSGWTAQAHNLITRYRELAAVHTLCTKHCKPKENLAILRSALETVTAGGELTARENGLLQVAVTAMVARRGAPSSPPHTALREKQAVDAARPSHVAVARVAASRLRTLSPDAGIEDVVPLLVPVSRSETREASGPHEASEADMPAGVAVPVGTVLPSSIQAVIRRCQAGTVEQLIDAGQVSSAEVLASFVPQITAQVLAAQYPDDALRDLASSGYRAFRRRRTLLLLNYEGQVRLDELPWVHAIAAFRRPDADRQGPLLTARRVATLSLTKFPGTILPNPLVRELKSLCRAAGADIPLTEELAADIFMGGFAPNFTRAARVAGGPATGDLYFRYYGIDRAALTGLGVPADRSDYRKSDFARMCLQRSNFEPGSWSVAANGAVIEQAQILTTHNLAALVDGVGVDLGDQWNEAARGAWQVVAIRVTEALGSPRPLRPVKDAAYAWRQAVFFLARCSDAQVVAFCAWARADARLRSRPVEERLLVILRGLQLAAAGRSAKVAADARIPFVGWVTSWPWLLR